MRKRQLSMLKPMKKTFGESSTKGNPRSARPLSTKHPIHLVMRSSKATGAKSFMQKKFALKIKALVEKHAAKNGIKVYRYANAGNHLHLVVKLETRDGFKNFVRVVSGLIARLVMRAERSAAKLKGERFWEARPFTRIAEWGRAFKQLCAYVNQNALESLGAVAYQPRGEAKKFSVIPRRL